MSSKEYEQLLTKFYDESDEEKTNVKQKLYKKYGTNKKCPKCNNKLLVSDLKEYQYLCLEC